MAHDLLDMPLTATTRAEPARTRPASPTITAHLLRSAVALQAEGLLRTAGALSGAWGGVLDRTSWIERDARDLSDLAAAALAAGARLPAGVDNGAGDPDRPCTAIEGLLAGHQALVTVLQQLAAAAPPNEIPVSRWRETINEILYRREQEMALLRDLGGAAEPLPPEHNYVHGVPPKH
jgi:hypothetical protein